ncbi:hypothetical protein [Arabiibacter massiliensis]|uniref:hypothetical protein n=1 Tax=Arabiibacter massiliensis TaxID=1870985 RepID=UPI00155A7AB5|nr:hypothetical protein [Arabiibacter massiliensis]
MDAMRQEAPDAVLLAVRTSTVVEPETRCSWSYLFGSEGEGCAYTAFTSEGKAYPAYLGVYEIDDEEWASIPPADEVGVDADQALSLALDAWGGEEAAENCYVYLLTHIAENEDPSAGTMKWYVEINMPDADGEALAATDGESPSGSAEAAFSVDARSGAVEKVK